MLKGLKKQLPVGVTALATAAVLGGVVGVAYNVGGDDSDDVVTFEPSAGESTETATPEPTATVEPAPVESSAPAPVESEPAATVEPVEPQPAPEPESTLAPIPVPAPAPSPGPLPMPSPPSGADVGGSEGGTQGIDY